MNSSEIAVLKLGPWAEIGDDHESVCGGWWLDVSPLLDVDGVSVPTAELADGSTRVYDAVWSPWRASLRGTVFADHDVDGDGADGSLEALEANVAELKALLSGQVVFAVHVGAEEQATVTGTVTQVRFGERGGFPAEVPVTVSVLVTEVS